MNITNPTTFGTPSLTLSTSNSSGTGGALRSDDTILVYDTTVPADIGTANTGDTSTASRRNHVHGGGASDISARAYNSGTLAVANATDTVVLFNADRWDTDAIHDVSSNTGRLTAKTAGVYVIEGHISFPTNTTGFRSVHIRAEGSVELAYETRAPSSNATNVSISTLENLAEDEYVELLVYQSSGGSLTLPADTEYQQSFGMSKILG